MPLGALTASAEVGTPTTYQGHSYATAAGAASADKPQSKLWYNDGSWWAIMTTASSVNIFRLDLATHTWVDTGTVVDPRIASTGDALWVGSTNKLYVASRTPSGTDAIRIFRYSYSASNQRYAPDPGFPVKISGGGSESVTIARDSLGKLWITFTRGSVVWVAHSTFSDTEWTTPFRIVRADTAVSADDISSVVALPGQIGVMWSDQASDAIRFAVHNDTAPDDVWAIETVDSGPGVSDDHINLKSMLGDDYGRVHAAVKTSLNDVAGSSPGDASIVVFSRSNTGTWTRAVSATIGANLTRPQLALDEDSKTLFVLQSTEGGGTVYYKSSPLGNGSAALGFGTGKGTPFMARTGAKINNVSTTKDPVNAATGLVAIATDQFTARYYHAEMSLSSGAPPDTTAPTVSTTSPAPSATGVGTDTAVKATFSEPMDAASIGPATFTLNGPAGGVAGTVTYDPGTRTVTLTPTGPLANDVSYTATITTGAKDTSGNAMAAAHSWSFATAAVPTTETVSVPASEDSYVVSGTTNAGKNFGKDTKLTVDGSPATISYVKFDVAAYRGATVQSASLRVSTANVSGSGSTGKQAVKLVSNDSWTETRVTYKTRPALGTTVGTLGPTGVNQAYTVALNPAGIQGALDGSPLSVGLNSGSSNGVDLMSRESGTPPTLVLVLQRG